MWSNKEKVQVIIYVMLWINVFIIKQLTNLTCWDYHRKMWNIHKILMRAFQIDNFITLTYFVNVTYTTSANDYKRGVYTHGFFPTRRHWNWFHHRNLWGVQDWKDTDCSHTCCNVSGNNCEKKSMYAYTWQKNNNNVLGWCTTERCVLHLEFQYRHHKFEKLLIRRLGKGVLWKIVLLMLPDREYAFPAANRP